MSTQKERYNLCKQIIYAMPLNTKFYSHHKHYKYLLNLMKEYPNYSKMIGEGILFFEISLNINRSPHIIFTRNDKTEDTFSWVSASKRNFKPEDAFENLCQAMRYSVKEHTDRAKEELMQLRNACNYCKTDYRLQIDHKEAFYELQKKYFRICLDNKIEIPEKFDREYSRNAGNIRTIPNEYKKFERNWIKYHGRFASYQLLCRTCNIRKGKKVISVICKKK